MEGGKSEYQARPWCRQSRRGTSHHRVARRRGGPARADLHGTDLRRAKLWSADLSGANLIEANLTKADLSGAKLTETNLSGARLWDADLSWVNPRPAQLRDDVGSDYPVAANLYHADLSGANLYDATLIGSNLRWANLRGANLTEADLRGVDFYQANLEEANLIHANLESALLVYTDLGKANLSGCRIFGISAWGLNLEGATQRDLIITSRSEPLIELDNLEVAQFVYLLLNNAKIREVIDAITSKVVLILGRFTAERKAVLDAIRRELRGRGYLPVLFDFEKPASRDLTETISTLAHMARFVIADITDTKSIPQELQRIVPDLPSVPVQPLLLASQREYGMFEHFQHYPWVLAPVLYEDLAKLLAEIDVQVIAPAEAKVEERRTK